MLGSIHFFTVCPILFNHKCVVIFSPCIFLTKLSLKIFNGFLDVSLQLLPGFLILIARFSILFHSIHHLQPCYHYVPITKSPTIYQPHTILTSSFRDTHLLTELPQDILQKMHGSSHNVAPHALINTLPIQISSPSEYRCENSLSPQSWYLNPDALQIWPPFHMFNDTKTILPILP